MFRFRSVFCLLVVGVLSVGLTSTAWADHTDDEASARKGEAIAAANVIRGAAPGGVELLALDTIDYATSVRVYADDPAAGDALMTLANNDATSAHNNMVSADGTIGTGDTLFATPDYQLAWVAYDYAAQSYDTASAQYLEAYAHALDAVTAYWANAAEGMGYDAIDGLRFPINDEETGVRARANATYGDALSAREYVVDPELAAGNAHLAVAEEAFNDGEDMMDLGDTSVGDGWTHFVAEEFEEAYGDYSNAVSHFTDAATLFQVCIDEANEAIRDYQPE